MTNVKFFVISVATMSCPELQYHRQEAIGSEVIEKYEKASITGKVGVIKNYSLVHRYNIELNSIN